MEFLTYLLTFTVCPALATAVPGSNEVPGGPVSNRIGRVDFETAGFWAKRSIDCPS